MKSKYIATLIVTWLLISRILSEMPEYLNF